MSIAIVPTASLSYAGMPENLAELKTADAVAAAAELTVALDEPILLTPLVTDEASAGAALDQLREANVHTVVLLPTMAALAGPAWACLRELQAPVAVWNRWGVHRSPADTVSLVVGSGPVGVAAITNVLARNGREFAVFTGSLAPGLIRYVRASAALGRLRTGGLARVGGANLPAMLDVALDADQLQERLGIKVVDLDLEHVTDIGDPGMPVSDVSADEADRSHRLAAAMSGACSRTGVVAGALNCHGAAIMGSDSWGVTGCWAAAVAGRDGIPFACTGDLCTAVAMYAAQALGGGAQYLEIDASDPSCDASLVTNGGEADLSMLRAQPAPRLRGNQFFPGRHGRGLAVDAVLAPGPVTAIAFTPIGEGYRLITAEGCVLDREPPALQVTRGFLRLGDDHVAVLDRWWGAGANHHCALAPGHIAADVAIFARMAGIQVIDVTSTR